MLCSVKYVSDEEVMCLYRKLIISTLGASYVTCSLVGFRVRRGLGGMLFSSKL